MNRWMIGELKMNALNRCPYYDKCKSKGLKCDTCKHNPGEKDYYEPDRPFDYPYPSPYRTPWGEPGGPNTYPRPPKPQKFWIQNGDMWKQCDINGHIVKGKAAKDFYKNSKFVSKRK